jgi:poly(A) polymerase
VNDRERAAREICARLREKGYEALLAGGCVRDRLLGREPKDYDVATDARPDELARIFPHTVPVGAAFGVMLVVTGAGPVETATFRQDGPYLDGRRPSSVAYGGAREDALRRDFTINALFLDPADDRIIDYVGGRADLEARVVRTVGNPHERFQEDYLRLLRAVRFAACLGYTIAPDALEAIRALAPRVLRTSAERIRDELIAMLTGGGARRAVELLDETGLLPHILPEIAAMKGVDQPPEFHPEGDVFIHTLIMLGHLDQLENPPPTLALGVLLHDVGKPPTQTFEDRIRFNEHERVGEKMAEAICRRLRLSNDQTERVTWLVKNHMRTALVPEMREAKRKRFVREPGFDELLALLRLDALGSHGGLEHHEWVTQYRAELAQETLAPAPLVRGHDLIALGYTPGPLFKEILQELEDAQLDGIIATKEEALNLLQTRWPRE